MKLTNFTCHIRVQTAKDNVALQELAGLALLHDQVGDLAHGGGLLPPHGILVLLSGRSRRGTDGVEDKVRVVLEQEDEALANGAGSTQHTNLLGRELRCHFEVTRRVIEGPKE